MKAYDYLYKLWESGISGNIVHLNFTAGYGKDAQQIYLNQALEIYRLLDQEIGDFPKPANPDDVLKMVKGSK